ncbi:unnamed protein product [Mytilus edulis]|uniref:Uncharacterized protein n=1 Tax=Mytilus edulis TaxID=6550 RepID=A0A8S3QYC0_MYTED|nr:unnamed protein product [Mytilus edulis]
MRNRACCHETHQESKTELKLDGKEDTRESAVFGDQNPELQRYTKNPTNESNLRAKESDELGEPNYDYARTGEISICTDNETQNSQEESGNHKKKNTSINEKEAMKKVDEHVVIETTEVKKKKKTNAKKPTIRTDVKSGAVHYVNETVDTSVKKKEKANRKRTNKRTRLKSGTAHYENEAVDSSVKKANDFTENESVLMRNTVSTSDLYENEGIKGSSNERQGNESNVYESIHGFPNSMMTVVNVDIEANNDDCMATKNKTISDSTSHNVSSTDRENVSTPNNNYTKNREKEQDERLGKRDSISKRESQGSGQSNDSRKSDESEESNGSNNSRSTETSIRSDNTEISIPSDNTPRESAPSTNPILDSSAMYIKAKYVQIDSSTNIFNMHTVDKLIVKS